MRLSTDARRAVLLTTAAACGAAAAWQIGRRQGARRVRTRERRLEQERADMFDRMLRTLDEERATLAHTLHDGPQQTMTAVRLMTDVVRDAIDAEDWERAREVLAKLDAVASQAADELRRATARLHPVVMAQQGLVQALGSLAETMCEEYGVEATFHPPDTGWEADDERDAAIYRIAREAAVNAARHGRPPLDIRLERNGRAVVMRVDDTGGRIDGDAVGAGIGMRMMRERAARIGARLDVRQQPERLTSVVLRVPVRP